MSVAGSGVDDGTGDGTIVGLATGIGDFTYTMSISAGDLGGNTDVQITPNHNFDNVIPRLVTSIYWVEWFVGFQQSNFYIYIYTYHSRIVSCNISHEEHVLYAMHSFLNDQLCVDNSRKRCSDSVDDFFCTINDSTLLKTQCGSNSIWNEYWVFIANVPVPDRRHFSKWSATTNDQADFLKIPSFFSSKNLFMNKISLKIKENSNKLWSSLGASGRCFVDSIR